VKLIGLDIGTSTICGLLLDAASAEIVSVVNRPNAGGLRGQPWESLQDPAAILETARQVVDGLLRSHPDVRGIGVAGQMHGVLYVDRAGRALGPLYTWQDGRGDLPESASPGGREGGPQSAPSTAARLTAALGARVSTGMGLVTHAWNAAHGQVPPGAAAICTIMDFVAMTLAGARSPVMDATNAASLGGFDPGALDFRRDEIARLGMDAALLPRVAPDYPALGEARAGVPVFAAAGDNQASFLGSVRDTRGTVSVNVGTSSQVSVRVDSPAPVPGMDVRPLPFGGWLAVGAGLCGGSAYELVRSFFERTLRLFGASQPVQLETMNAVTAAALEGTPLEVDTRFSGTREDPALRGAVTGIGLGNFTPEHLVVGVREGIATELLDFYGRLPPARRAEITGLVGSGNAIRRNGALRQVFERRLGLRMKVPAHREETSFGAALLAGVASGTFPDLAAAGALVRYES